MALETTVNLEPKSTHNGGASQPIANYGLLADCNSAALVDRDGSIDWLCLPRYDSDAVFARILDSEARHWLIRPQGSYVSERRYLPGTLIVETIFTTDRGRVRLRDAMAFAEGQRGHELGHAAPHELLRGVMIVRSVCSRRQTGVVVAAPRSAPICLHRDIRRTRGGSRSIMES